MDYARPNEQKFFGSFFQKRTFLWAGRVILALLFLMTGGHKLLADPMMVEMFRRIGLGQGFRNLTGAIEVGCAVLLLWPRSSVYAALVLTGVMVGAFGIQAFVLHGDVIHTIVIGGLVATLAWVQRPSRDPLRPI